jgi:NADPH:quinone reductase-like Zn-dependent oxidoreductase
LSESGSGCSRANKSGSNYSPLTGLIEAGKLIPVLDRTYPLAGTAESLRRVEQGHARGKVVITVA